MKKTTSIIQDKKQTRTTIPQEFVDKLKINKKDKMEWDLESNKLKGNLVKDNPTSVKHDKK